VTDSIYDPDRPRRARESLVAEIDWEIARRRRGGYDSPAATSGYPADALLELTGCLALMAPAAALLLYEQTLWPRVREALGVAAPGELAGGSVEDCLSASRRILGPLAEVLDLAARAKPPARTAVAWEDEAIALLQRRVGVGFYLQGLEALWLDQGRSAARRLWHDGRVGEWDEYLALFREDLAPIAPRLRDLVADSPACLDGDWFGVLRDILVADDEGRLPEVSARPTQGAPDLGPAEHGLLVGALLRDYLGEDAPVEVLDRDAGLFGVTAPEGPTVAVWLPGEGVDGLTLQGDAPRRIAAVALAEVLVLADPADDDGETACSILHLLGAVAVDRLPIRIPRSAFGGDHDHALRTLLDGFFGPAVE
jgi:hypothetical protein